MGRAGVHGRARPLTSSPASASSPGARRRRVRTALPPASGRAARSPHAQWLCCFLQLACSSAQAPGAMVSTRTPCAASAAMRRRVNTKSDRSEFVPHVVASWVPHAGHSIADGQPVAIDKATDSRPADIRTSRCTRGCHAVDGHSAAYRGSGGEQNKYLWHFVFLPPALRRGRPERLRHSCWQ